MLRRLMEGYRVHMIWSHLFTCSHGYIHGTDEPWSAAVEIGVFVSHPLHQSTDMVSTNSATVSVGHIGERKDLRIGWDHEPHMWSTQHSEHWFWCVLVSCIPLSRFQEWAHWFAVDVRLRPIPSPKESLFINDDTICWIPTKLWAGEPSAGTPQI